ncbi:UNVERIFIED_CONTAM: hypothetical protein RMT77_007128 [Armadillidium vulgare]
MAALEEIPDFCCPICSFVFSEIENKPYVTGCGHVHCSKCLNRLVNSDNYIYGNIHCSKCRAPIPIDYETKFPVCYTILGAIDTIRSTPQKNDFIEFQNLQKSQEHVTEILNKKKNKIKEDIESTKEKIKEYESKRRLILDAIKYYKQVKYNEYESSIREEYRKREIVRNNQLFLDNQKKLNDRFSSGQYPLYFPAFFVSPNNFYITSQKTSATTTFSTKGDLMYVNSFLQPLNSCGKSEIKMYTLRPYIKGAFISFGFGKCSSLVEFEFFDRNGTRARHFIERCLGEEKNFRKADIYKHNRVGLEGESFCVGIKGDNGTALSDLTLNSGCARMDDIKSGYITAAENEHKINHFKLFIEDSPSESCFPTFGRVTRGLSPLKYATKNRLMLQILECGVIIDFVNQ